MIGMRLDQVLLVDFHAEGHIDAVAAASNERLRTAELTSARSAFGRPVFVDVTRPEIVVLLRRTRDDARRRGEVLHRCGQDRPDA
jgi:hypothetical protein